VTGTSIGMIGLLKLKVFFFLHVSNNNYLTYVTCINAKNSIKKIK
jgi:hypothetical protein